MRFYKALAGILAAVMGFCVVVPAMAAPAANVTATAPQSIRALQQAHLMSRKVGTAYYKFALENRKPEEKRRLQEFITQVDALLGRSDAPAVSQAWQAVKAASAVDPYTSSDVDQIKLYSMEDAQMALDQAFTQELARIRSANRLPPAGKGDQLMELAVLMERMAGTYIRNAADPMGGANYSGRGANLDPAAMAKQFSGQLASTRTAYAADQDASAELNDVFQKWNFIRARMIDYNQKTVPYIVSTYNDQITRKLTNLYERSAS